MSSPEFPRVPSVWDLGFGIWDFSPRYSPHRQQTTKRQKIAQPRKRQRRNIFQPNFDNHPGRRPEERDQQRQQNGRHMRNFTRFRNHKTPPKNPTLPEVPATRLQTSGRVLRTSQPRLPRASILRDAHPGRTNRRSYVTLGPVLPFPGSGTLVTIVSWRKPIQLTQFYPINLPLCTLTPILPEVSEPPGGC
jgi:hypothetical protein